MVLGSLLGNSFVVGRMTVAAANKSWLPSILGTVGKVGPYKVSSSDAEDADAAMDKGESPINALLLSTVLAAIYILVADMRVLLTFNGLGEYSFFFLTVLSDIILRLKEPELERPVKPFILIPGVFAIISGFVVVRGAIFAPIQAAILICIWVCGGLLFLARKQWLRGQTE